MEREKLGGFISIVCFKGVITGMEEALGENGPRLCKVDKIQQDGDNIKVYTHETVCSAGESQGSARKCTYSMGAVCGAIETIQGKRYRPKHTESVLRGGSHDVFEMTLIG